MYKIVEFIKKNLIISASLSIAIAIGYYFLRGMNEPWINTAFIGFSFMGMCSICVILLGIWFPKYTIKDYVEECDPEDYVTVYFYEGYHNGFCKVVKLYGDPGNTENMERMFSFVDDKGEFITDKWFYDVGEFDNNRCIVSLGDYQYNIINEKGEFVCKRDYPGMAQEVFDGKVKVGDGEGGINFVDMQTGEELWRNFKKEMYYER